MLRLLIISILLVAVNTEHSVDEFVGDWLLAVTYQSRSEVPYCHWFSFKNAELNYRCGDEEIPAMVFEDTKTHMAKQVPVIVIDETEHEDFHLNRTCTFKGEQMYPVLLKKINSKYFMGTGAMLNGGVVTYSTAVFVKKMPGLLELQEVLHSVPELRGKEPVYMCHQNSSA